MLQRGNAYHIRQSTLADAGVWEQGKLESRTLGEMKRAYELDVYKLAEELSDMVWSMKAKFPILTFHERL